MNLWNAIVYGLKTWENSANFGVEILQFEGLHVSGLNYVQGLLTQN